MNKDRDSEWHPGVADLFPEQQMQRASNQRPARLRPGRFVAVFVIAALVQFAILLAPWARPAIDGLSWTLVQASATAITSFGGQAEAHGVVMRSPSSGFAIEMKDGCNGVNVMILLWSAILAFPVSKVSKAVGLAVGAAAIHGLNFFRFVSLFYIGQYSQAWFDFAHLYLWETLILLDAVIVFGVWVRRSSARMAA